MDWIPADLLDGLLMDARETLRKAGVQLPELGTADSAEVPEDSQPWVQALAGTSARVCAARFRLSRPVLVSQRRCRAWSAH